MLLKKWQLNLKTFSLTQVIKFDHDIKGVIYFEAESWKAADEFVATLLNRKEYKREIPNVMANLKPNKELLLNN